MDGSEARKTKDEKELVYCKVVICGQPVELFLKCQKMADFGGVDAACTKQASISARASHPGNENCSSFYLGSRGPKLGKSFRKSVQTLAEHFSVPLSQHNFSVDLALKNLNDVKALKVTKFKGYKGHNLFKFLNYVFLGEDL